MKNLNLKIIQKFKKLTHQFVCCLKSKLRIIIYGLVFIVGVVLIVISFKIRGNWNNIINGIGTGLFSSLLLTILIEHINFLNYKKRNEKYSKLIFKPLFMKAEHIYIDVLKKVNNYIINEKKSSDWIDKIYNDRTKFDNLMLEVKSLETGKMDDYTYNNILELIDFNFTYYKMFLDEYTNLPITSLILDEIISEEQAKILTKSDTIFITRTIMKKINDSKQVSINASEDRINIIHNILVLSISIITAFNELKNSIALNETNLIKDFNQKYFDNVYSWSDEYIENELERKEYECEQYYEFTECEEDSEQDKTLKDVYCCLMEWTSYDINELLKQLEPNSSQVIKFFKQDDVKKCLKKKHKLKKAIKNTYGKLYLKNILK